MADTAEFDDFVVMRSAALLRTAYLLVHDEGLAEDLLQTALAKAWFSWRRIDGEPEAYVRRVLVTTHISSRRRRWRGEIPTDPLPDGPRGARSDLALDRHDLWGALAHPSAGQRAVVVLRYFEDLTEAATAEVMGCSIGTVKSQGAKALAKLRIDETLHGYAEETADHEL
jgi:RNA polymerase sigma-70 factor (sigma-E family)